MNIVVLDGFILNPGDLSWSALEALGDCTIHDRTPRHVQGLDVTMTELDALLRESDVVTLHCPLTPQTQNMINAKGLATMKPTALLINTGRGPLIDEAALADALNNNRLAGAGLDVLSSEPPQADNPLPTARNCHITPHIAWATRAARQRLMDTVVANVKRFQAGKPENVVNGGWLMR